MISAIGQGWRVGSVTLLIIVLAAARASQQPAAPVAVRNERPREGTEVLVLRHQQLRKGAHDAYYRSSLDGVWPWYEKIGTRIVGQWMVISSGRAGGRSRVPPGAIRQPRALARHT